MSTILHLHQALAERRLRQRMRAPLTTISPAPRTSEPRVDNTREDRLTWPEVIAAVIGFGGYLFLLVATL